MTVGQAIILANWLWSLLLLFWLLMALGAKKAKMRETPAEILQHLVPLIIAIRLVFGPSLRSTWLNRRLWQESSLTPWLGLGLCAIGVAIAVWARLVLGKNWSGLVTLKDDHELIRKGLYRWIRHPIYSGLLLGFLGTAIIRGNPRSWLGFAIVLATFYFKARREERFLRQEFGAGLEEHIRRTGMFLPKWT
jgi:protein-S-isoprenylcysteine O-methyltransferase Ste14